MFAYENVWRIYLFCEFAVVFGQLFHTLLTDGKSSLVLFAKAVLGKAKFGSIGDAMVLYC